MNKACFFLILSLIFTISKCYESTFFSSSSGSFSTSNVDFPVSVSGLPSVLSSVSVIRVSVAVTTGGPSSVMISLVSPSGKEVGLYYQGRISSSSFTNIVFRDDGNEFAAGHNGANSGVLIPISRLNQFNGENPNGSWKLRARMSSGSSTLTSWSLLISDYCDYNPCLNGGRCDPNTLSCECSINNEGRLCENSFNIIGNEFVIGTQQHVLLPDNGQAQSTVSVPNIPFIGNVQVRAFITLPHTWLNDMVINLINSNANSVSLVNRNGGSQWNTIINTEFNDNAPLTIAQVTLTSGVPQTYLKPLSGTLNSLGSSTAGTWTLQGFDQVGIDVGTFYKWSLHLSGPNACPSEIFENSRFQFSGGGQTTNGTCRSGFYGFTSRGCITVDGVAQWENNLDGNCFSCPPNSYAPLGSTLLSQCVCNNGYGKNNGICVPIFCPVETIGSITYSSTQAGNTFSVSCGPNFIGSIQRVCSQNGDTPIWLNVVVNCICPSTGFTLNGNSCDDINECLTNNGGCGTGACFNTPGSRTCNCPPGYSLVNSVCQDVNECSTNNGGCGTGTCTNTEGSRTCTCNLGYYFNGRTCVDLNECDNNNGGCGEGGSCQNTIGSYLCQCFAGYSLSGNTCVDINECATNNGGCGTGTCTNTAGSRICSCPSGYSFNGLTCVDIDECASNNGGCAPTGGKCTNTPGSRTCSCFQGFTGNGLICNDIDECLTNNGGCLNGDCVNTIGSRTCSCFPGFFLDGSLFCRDINECSTNNGGCSSKANCVNTFGSRNCTCITGYQGDGIHCVDINECLVNNGGCPSTSNCVNIEGSRQCACPPQTVGNGFLCSDRKQIHYTQFNPITRFSFDGHLRDEARTDLFADIGSAKMFSTYQRNYPINQAVRLTTSDTITIPPIILPTNFTFEVLLHTISYPISPSLSDILIVMPEGKTLRSEAMLIVSIDSNGKIIRESNGVVLNQSNKVVRIGATQSLMVSYFSGRLVTQFDGTTLTQITNFNNHIDNTSYAIQSGNNFDGYIDEIGAFRNPLTVNRLQSITSCKNACPTGNVCVNTLSGESCTLRVF